MKLYRLLPDMDDMTLVLQCKCGKNIVFNDDGSHYFSQYDRDYYGRNGYWSNVSNLFLGKI